MAKKKNEEVEETTVETVEAETTAEVAVEAQAEETAPAVDAAPAEEAVVEAAPVTEEKPKKEVAAVATAPAEAKKAGGKRAEKVGIVSSDKMTKTVVVRVDRLVKHPIYRKYVKKRKKFMAHDEMGAKIGDKVKIVETRPLSARKRWRVVEIIQKAQS